MSSDVSDQSTPPARALNVQELFAHGDLPTVVEVRAGHAGLSRPISHPRVQKSGLALVGHMLGIVPTRVQILGETEMSYLDSLDAQTLRARVDDFLDLQLSCIVVTRGVEPPPALGEASARTETPLLVSDRRSSRTINAIHLALDELLAPSTTVHGVLVEIHGVGLLLLGPSGIGKSECALSLVERGHRLVADDQVILSLRPSGRVDAMSPPLLRYHLEVRGVGILNIRHLFGATAVRDRKNVDLVVELQRFGPDQAFERLGLDDQGYPLFDTVLPKLRIPVSPGRDMAVILEAAARNHLLKLEGTHSARDFAKNLAQELGLPDPT